MATKKKTTKPKKPRLSLTDKPRVSKMVRLYQLARDLPRDSTTMAAFEHLRNDLQPL